MNNCSIFAAITCVLVLSKYYFFSVKAANQFWWHILVIIDAIKLSNDVFSVVQCGLILSAMANSFNLFQFLIINNINQMLSKIVKQCQVLNWRGLNEFNERQLQLPHGLWTVLNWIHREHNLVCNIYMFTYLAVWSNTLLVYLIISIPLNAIAVSALCFKELINNDRLVIYIIIVVHSLITIVPLMGMDKQTKSIHDATRWLVPIIQAMVCGNRSTRLINFQSLRLKLKYNNMFYLLNCGPKFGPRIATIGAIRKRTIVNVSVVAYFQLD